MNHTFVFLGLDYDFTFHAEHRVYTFYSVTYAVLCRDVPSTQAQTKVYAESENGQTVYFREEERRTPWKEE